MAVPFFAIRSVSLDARRPIAMLQLPNAQDGELIPMSLCDFGSSDIYLFLDLMRGLR